MTELPQWKLSKHIYILDLQFCTLSVVLVSCDEGPLYTYSACIGSGGAGSTVEGFMFKFNCSEGIIRIRRAISYSKPTSTGCPEYYDPSRPDCCVYHQGKIS